MTRCDCGASPSLSGPASEIRLDDATAFVDQEDGVAIKIVLRIEI
jgi:hypothetical protein